MYLVHWKRMVNKNAYNTLCDKFEPYVTSALKDESMTEFIDKIQKEQLIEIEQLNEKTRKYIEKNCPIILPKILSTDELESLRMVWIMIAIELIPISWSEALRWTYKKQGEVQLQNYLLPENLGSAEEAWNSNLSRFSLKQEQIKDLLRTFGQKEITDSIELPWGGYVQRVGDNYKLRGPKQID